MNVWSLFAGIGGFDLGLAREGFRVSLQAESDIGRRAVLREQFPESTLLKDVRDIRPGGEPARGSQPPSQGGDTERKRRKAGAGVSGHPDVIVGGFPCQDVSIAGRRDGFGGNRSVLFWEFHRIVAAFRPSAFVVENVPGLLTSRSGQDFAAVVRAFTECGYGLAWRVLDSQHFGVPQRRRRLYLVGVDSGGPGGAERAGEILAIQESMPGDPGQGGEKRLRHGSRTEGPTGEDGLFSFHMIQDPVSSRHLAPALGRKSSGMGLAKDARLRRMTPTECERLQGFPDGWTAPLGFDTPRYEALGDAVTVPVAQWLAGRLRTHLG